MFRAYRWPGNIRELRNTLERMAVMARPQGGEAARAVTGATALADVPLDIRRAVAIGPLLTETAESDAKAGDSARLARSANSDGAFQIDPEQIRSLEQLQVEYARWVLGQFGGNKTKTAKALGIQRSTLYAWTEWDSKKKTDD